MYTQVIDIRKYGGIGNAHLSTTLIKKQEREALTLFRVGVAPVFVSVSNSSASKNRFSRTCEFCEHAYGAMHLSDAFHTLFICPLVSAQRVRLWNTLDNKCGACEWVSCETIVDLGISLLCPQAHGVVFLCEC